MELQTPYNPNKGMLLGLGKTDENTMTWARKMSNILLEAPSLPLGGIQKYVIQEMSISLQKQSHFV